MDVRCPNKKHAELVNGIIEVKCQSSFCGAARGVVVLHRFNLSGELLETKRFRDPGPTGE